jgi:hypothetical protein
MISIRGIIQHLVPSAGPPQRPVRKSRRCFSSTSEQLQIRNDVQRFSTSARETLAALNIPSDIFIDQMHEALIRRKENWMKAIASALKIYIYKCHSNNVLLIELLILSACSPQFSVAVVIIVIISAFLHAYLLTGRGALHVGICYKLRRDRAW